jgi:hypothetical protein
MKTRKPVTVTIAWVIFFGVVVLAIVIGSAFAQTELYAICDGDICSMSQDTWNAIKQHVARLQRLVGKECI